MPAWGSAARRLGLQPALRTLSEAGLSKTLRFMSAVTTVALEFHNLDLYSHISQEAWTK